jgi:hypothetical protein
LASKEAQRCGHSMSTSNQTARHAGIPRSRAQRPRVIMPAPNPPSPARLPRSFLHLAFLLRQGQFALSHPELPSVLFRFCLHLSCRRWPFRAVVLVNSAPQFGQDAFAAWPDFSLWCRSKLLNVENCRPLQPCSQHWGFGRLCTTRT